MRINKYMVQEILEQAKKIEENWICRDMEVFMVGHG